ncbi:MAG: hypothetical protein ACOYCD_01620 [Kiritimatiellia bacterium]|jgi:hypothetical protein
MNIRICISLALAFIFNVALWADEAITSLPDAPPRMANGKVLEGTVEQALPEGLVMQTSRGSVTYPWKYLSPGTRNRFELPMLAELKRKAEAEAKAAAAKAAREKKAAEAKAKKEAEAKAKKEAEAAAATNAAAASATVDTNAAAVTSVDTNAVAESNSVPAVDTNAVADAATNTPSAGN